MPSAREWSVKMRREMFLVLISSMVVFIKRQVGLNER